VSQDRLLKLFRSSAPFITIATIVVISVIAVIVSYGLYLGYLDHGEPIIAMAALKMIEGQQIYPSFKSDLFTNNLYGPYLYFVNGAFLKVLGANTLTGKTAGLFAATGSMAFIFFAYRHTRFHTATSWFDLIAMGGFILLNLPYSIWIRPDPFLVLLTTIAIFVIRRAENRDGYFDRASWLTPLLIGLLGGVAVGFKIYAAAYIFPIAVLYFLSTKSFLSILVMSVSGFGAAFLPFVLPVFSLSGFLEWFSLIAEKAATAEMFERAIRYSAFFLIPALAVFALRITTILKSRASLIDPQLGYAAATLIGLCVCISLASKPGAGADYVLPFAAITIDMLVRWFHYDGNIGISGRWTAGLIVALLIVTSIPVQKRFYRALQWDHAQAIQSDLAQIMGAHPNKTIQMAIGSGITGYKKSIYKSVLVFEGNPYTIDFGIMMETSLLQVPIANGVIRRMTDCRTDIWLVPKDEPPMEMVGYYNTVVVSEELRAAFKANYSPIAQSEFFDIWSCRHPHG